MKNYILLLLLILLSGPSYSQRGPRLKQPVKKTSIKTIGVDEKNKQKVGPEIRKRKVQRRGDRTKGKKSVENRNDRSTGKNRRL